MENKRYFFHPTGKLNQDYSMDDENKLPVYTAKAVKKGIFTAWQYEFTDHVLGTTQVHKVGHTVTVEQQRGEGMSLFDLGSVATAVADWLSTRSWFKYDGQKIWDYLHEQGIKINNHMAQGKLGMRYDVTLNDQPLATITMAAPNGKPSILGSSQWYEVETTGENVPLAFLTAFAIAKTEHTFYN